MQALTQIDKSLNPGSNVCLPWLLIISSFGVNSNQKHLIYKPNMDLPHNVKNDTICESVLIHSRHAITIH